MSATFNTSSDRRETIDWNQRPLLAQLMSEQLTRDARDWEPEHSVRTSFSLLERNLAGDADSWTHLSRTYGPIIFGWVRECGIQSHDANDIAQEVLIKAYKELRGLKYSQGRFRGWLWTITRNLVRDHVRKRSRLPALTDPVDLDGLATPACWNASESMVSPRPIVERALQLLEQNFKEHTWRAAWKIIVEDRRPVDVAEEFNMSLNSVYVAKSRVLKKLRQLLTDVSRSGRNAERRSRRVKLGRFPV